MKNLRIYRLFPVALILSLAVSASVGLAFPVSNSKTAKQMADGPVPWPPPSTAHFDGPVPWPPTGKPGGVIG